MRHVKMVGLCLVAVFVFAALAASSASAAKPEWGKCVKASEVGKKGQYNDANCTEKGGSKEYYWEKGKTLKPVPFKGHSPAGSGGVLTTGLAICGAGTYTDKRVPRKKCEEGGGKWESPGAVLKVECENEASEGVAEGKNKIGDVHVRFTGCHLSTPPCTGTHGEATGEVKTSTLKGELGYLNKDKQEVGVVLTPQEKNGLFAEFICLGVDLTHVGVGNKKEGAWYEPENHGGYDSIISPITPVNTMTDEYTQVYKVNSEGENEPFNFEGKPKDQLEDYIENTGIAGDSTVWQKAGEEITNINVPEEPGEIKA